MCWLHTAILEKPLAFLIIIPIAVEASGHLLIIPVAAVVTIGTVIICFQWRFPFCLVRLFLVLQLQEMKKSAQKIFGSALVQPTLRAGCSKAEPKNFAPPQTPFPEARDGQNLISWRWSLTLPTNPVWWGSMHAISSYHGNRPTNTNTHT